MAKYQTRLKSKLLTNRTTVNARQMSSSPPDDWTRWMEEGQPSNWLPQICFGHGAVYCRDLFPFGRRLRGMF
jgi:hypothetical protein